MLYISTNQTFYSDAYSYVIFHLLDTFSCHVTLFVPIKP